MIEIEHDGRLPSIDIDAEETQPPVAGRRLEVRPLHEENTIDGEEPERFALSSQMSYMCGYNVRLLGPILSAQTYTEYGPNTVV